MVPSPSISLRIETLGSCPTVGTLQHDLLYYDVLVHIVQRTVMIYLFLAWYVMQIFVMPNLCQNLKNKKIIKLRKQKIYVLFLPHPCLFISLCDLNMGLVFLLVVYMTGQCLYCDIHQTLGVFLLNLTYRGRSFLLLPLHFYRQCRFNSLGQTLSSCNFSHFLLCISSLGSRAYLIMHTLVSTLFLCWCPCG